MRYRWLNIFLLGTFAFWASGAARFAHEQIEHHGHDESSQLDDDDDDDGPPSAVNAASQTAPHTDTHPDPHSHHPCPVCQMLAAMTVHHAPPLDFPINSELSTGTATVVDRTAPTLHACFELSARDPPPVTFHS
jgi:hypothetical protein